MTKMGRPGEGKAKHGRLRGQVRPELKRQAEELVKRDARFSSVSKLMGISLAFYMQEYERAHGNIDPQCFPILPCSSSDTAGP